MQREPKIRVTGAFLLAKKKKKNTIEKTVKQQF